VWAVGYFVTLHKPLAEHWDGQTWRTTTPQARGQSSTFASVAAITPTDAWAVGGYGTGSVSGTLIEHWDGLRWSLVQSPSVGTISNVLYGVAANSSSDVWAVGLYDDSNGVSQTLVEHWDGLSWSIVPSPGGEDGGTLRGVVAISSSDVWAVGESNGGQSLIEHWDGTGWGLVPSPSPQLLNVLQSVSAVSSTDVWTAGWQSLSGQSSLVEHWDGTQWSVVPGPDIAGSTETLQGVWAISADDIWAVGMLGAGPPYVASALIEHWDGASWTIVPSPSFGTIGTQLNGVWAASGTDAYAVGWSYKTQIVQRPIALRDCA
jgi:hypothetical protein